MESVEIFTESNKELHRIKKSLSVNSTVNINFDKLDIETAKSLRQAITETVQSRLTAIYGIVYNAH